MPALVRADNTIKPILLTVHNYRKVVSLVLLILQKSWDLAVISQLAHFDLIRISSQGPTKY